MNNESGCEFAPQNPGWIKQVVPNELADDKLKRIILFYVINTPCADLSSSGLPLSHYGWNKKAWVKTDLKKALFETASLRRGVTFFSVKHINEMKSAFRKTGLSKGFHENRDVERIVFYKPSRYNEWLSVFYHIRNSLAHGRLAMYPCQNDVIFALEDGVKKQDAFQVRFRMIVKRSTLLRWIDIIERGKIDSKDEV